MTNFLVLYTYPSQVGQCVGGCDQKVHRDASAAVGGARPHRDGPRHRHALHHMLAEDKG